MEPLKSIGGAQTRSCAWAKRMSRIWSHYASITADRRSKHGISRALILNSRASLKLIVEPGLYMLLRFQKAAGRGNYETGNQASSKRLRFLTIRLRDQS